MPWIALLALSVSIELVSSSARVTSVKSYKRSVVCDGHPDPKIGPQVYLGPIKSTMRLLALALSAIIFANLSPCLGKYTLHLNYLPMFQFIKLYLPTSPLALVNIQLGKFANTFIFTSKLFANASIYNTYIRIYIFLKKKNIFNINGMSIFA